MLQVQQYLDDLLNHINCFPVLIHSAGPMPNDPAYRPIRSIAANGLTFTTRELIHAIGCKMANLPVNNEDKALSYASVYIHILDLESQYLVFKEGIGFSSDFQIFYSEGIGVGVTCLIANKCFNIPWDQLEPVPGPETRFDYRGKSGSLDCIFESKGTKYPNKQSSQIIGGINKKKIYRKRRARFDIGLVISACIGVFPQEPRIVVADPEFTKVAFGGNSNIYYRYRHFVRVLQFIGATPLAREIYMKSNALLSGGELQRPLFEREILPDLESVIIDGKKYVGRWFDSWIPKDTSRYERLRSLELPAPLSSRPKVKIGIFQGLLVDNYMLLAEGNLAKIKIPISSKLSISASTKNGWEASIFPDGTTLVIRVS